MSKIKDIFLIDPKEYNSDVKLLGAEVMKSRRDVAGRKTKQREIPTEYSMEELKRFAQMVIDERMKFCRDYKKDEPFDECVCQSIERYIRLFKDSPMRGNKHLTKLRLEAIQKLFNNMIREGKIKCSDNNNDNGNNKGNDQNNQSNQPV